jgi:hypothetical protein
MGWLSKRGFNALIFVAATGCLDRGLKRFEGEPTAPELESLEERDAHTREPETITEQERRNYVAELRSNAVAHTQSPSNDEEFFRLIQEMNDSPESYAVSMTELRQIQNAVLSQNFSSANGASSATPPTDPDVIELSDPSDCPAVEPKVKITRGGQRLATYLPRKDACGLLRSKRFEGAFNRALRGQATTLLLGAERAQVRSLSELRSWMDAHGFQMELSYRTYLAPFMRAYSAEGDLYAADSEIATPLWLRAPIRQLDGSSVLIPAPHSEVFIKVRRAEERTEAWLKIYFSDKGFVFDDEDLHLPAWTGQKVIERIDASSADRLFALAEQLHRTFEIYKGRAPQGLPMGGFGLLGVCNDGAALLMHAFRDGSFIAPFPLVRSDRVAMPNEFPLKSSWDALPSDTSSARDSVRASIIRRLLVGNPFEGLGSPFPNYDAALRKLREELP